MEKCDYHKRRKARYKCYCGAKFCEECYKDKRTKSGLYSACKECCISNHKSHKREYQKKYRREHLEEYNEYQRKYVKKYRTGRGRKKYLCCNKFRYYLRRGKVEKKPCEICGSLKVQGHHEDYSKPLEVRWLCSKHHQELHLSQLKT